MIPCFPKFDSLSIHQHDIINEATALFPPYSDFNFTSMFSYNTEEDMAVSILNDNLVVRFTDYLDRKPFYSFLGNAKVNETTEMLLQFSSEQKLHPSLKLIPEHVAALLDSTLFSIEEDEDNVDYVLDIPRLTTYAGKKLGPKRNFVNRFKRMHDWETVLLDLNDPIVQNGVHALFLKWVQQKGINYEDAENEYLAIQRIFHLAPKGHLLTIGIFAGEEFAGFVIVEVLPDGHSILHFEKADAERYVGIYQMLMMETAKILEQEGAKYLNYEQDLGIHGLRKAKLSFDPCAFHKKYIVAKQR